MTVVRTVDLRVGYRCNQRCRFCDQGDGRLRIADATTEAVRAALRAHPGEAVWLAGGEVTARADLPALVRAAREAGFRRVGIQTNGRIVAAPGAAAALRQAGLTDATVAIHAPEAGMHDWLTGEPGAFRQATVGVRRLREAGVSTRLASVITRSAVDTLPELARLALRLGVEGHRWILARHEGAAAEPGPALVPPLARVEEPLAAALDLELEARLDAETVGIPLCRLGRHRSLAADRPDAPPVARVTATAHPEPVRPRAWAPGCASCALRAACPGVDPWALRAFGPEEVRAPETPGLETAWVGVEAGCSFTCPGCPVAGGAGATETSRRLKQRVVRAVGRGARRVVLAGGSPWDHPALPGVVRDLSRLGVSVVVRGPLHPLAEVDEAVFDRLEGVEVWAVAVPGSEAAASRAEVRLRARGIAVSPAAEVPGPWVEGIGPVTPCTGMPPVNDGR